jgi:hypothetical protein
MIRRFVVAAAIVAGVLGASLPAQATPIVGVTISNDGTQFGPGFTSLGYSFVASVATNVVSLGVWDQDSDGLLGSHEVGLWASDRTLLASTVVGAGNAGILDSGFRFTDISPVPLTAGQTYYVAALFNGPGDDNAVDDPTSVLTAPQITYDSRRFGCCSGGPGLKFPDLVGFGTTGHWGGNVRLDASAQPVPEPTTMLLLGSGVAAAVLRRRRR